MTTTDQPAAASGPYQPTWESLETHPVPAWYVDGKFGIFIHWGAYSVPAYASEWYPRQMYRRGQPEFDHHVATYGPQSQFGYKDFIPRFQAEAFDPAGWADLFRRAGARFIVPVAEHHDGFAMYDTALSDWSATKMGPKRDVIGELADAVRSQGMILGVSSHRAEHWWFYDEGRTFDSDVRDPRFSGLYGPAEPKESQPNAAFLDDWLARTIELVDKYQPQLVWFDWWIEQPAFETYLRRFAAHYYNRGAEWGREVAINYKLKTFPERAAVFDVERGQVGDIRPLFWQNDTSISKNSWGYVVPQDYKTADDLIGDLCDVVSKNGALLLNIGPRADATIPEPEQAILLEIGRWLATNGEAIYGTRPWRVFGEGPTRVVEGSFSDTKRDAYSPRDVRFTTKGNALYAIVLGRPEGEAVVRSLSADLRLYTGEVGEVHILGIDSPAVWQRDASGLRVAIPADLPGEHAIVLKITPK